MLHLSVSAILVLVSGSLCELLVEQLPKVREDHQRLENAIRGNMATKIKTGKLAESGRKTPSNATFEQRIRNMGPSGLTMIKRNSEKRIRRLQKRLNGTAGMDNREKDFKYHLLELVIEEMTESERDMLDAELALKKSLLMDFSDPSALMENSKKRLEALRVATLKEEQSYHRIKSIEEAILSYEEHRNHTKSLMDEFLKEIADAADQLESVIEEKIIPEGNAMLDPSHIEAVIHLKEGDGNVHLNSSESDADYDERLDMLIDAQNNKFILSHPKDTTSPSIDHYLILDLIYIYLASFVFGHICSFFGILSIFGYIMAGLALGPGGYNVVQAIVQVETFGEFGVYLIMFFAGLEISLEKVQKVWKVALKASMMISIVMMASGMIIGVLLNNNIPLGESAFIAICLSMSSTPLVTRFLHEPSTCELLDHTTILLAMLIMQDVQVGVTVAVLPTFVPSNFTSYSNAIVSSLILLFRTTGSIAAVILFILLFARYFVPKYFEFISKQSPEIQMLGALLFMFVFQLLTNFFGISMELGCFIAGFLISTFNYQSIVEKNLQPIHDLFVILFFATVGFHVFPRFFAEEIYYLVCLAAVVIFGKYLISFLVLHWTLASKQKQVKWLISGGLAQVSEFAFVLSSRARHLKIISREIFLLILSITTLSLVFAPIIWKASMWKFRKTLHVI